MSAILLDTQIFVWAARGDKRLPESIHRMMSREEHVWVLHQASIWEMQIKHDLGKLPLPEPPRLLIPRCVAAMGLSKSPISDDAIYMLGQLPSVHRDPFDRLLVAEAIVQGWPVATVDSVMKRYPIRIV